MKQTTSPQDLVLALATGWGRLERRLDAALSSARGVSFAEYRILRVLADAPEGKRSRVDLASMVGLTPSGITRALRPLEKTGVVATEKSERDARLALASLTRAGRELVGDGSAVLDDVLMALMERAGGKGAGLSELIEQLVLD